MTAVVMGEDRIARCPWAGGPGPMREYHDHEWGRPVRGEAALFERLTLEAFQSGLSWSTILAKREAFREAFAGFDVDVVAGYGEGEVARLMADARIVRNLAKIRAAVVNANAVRSLRDQEGFEALVGGYAPEVQPEPATTEEVPSTSPESKALARELKRRGFTFVGPTTLHALMEATGMVNTHLTGCHRRAGCST
ncbi:MAG: DNA-3-methyladenine glycosylase I [Marmoricola sp.]